MIAIHLKFVLFSLVQIISLIIVFLSTLQIIVNF